jgi:hypothetical protein
MELEGSGHMITFTWSCPTAPLLCSTQTVRLTRVHFSILQEKSNDMKMTCGQAPVAVDLRYTARLPFFSFSRANDKNKSRKKNPNRRQVHRLREKEEEKRAPSADKAVSSIINTFNLSKKSYFKIICSFLRIFLTVSPK